MSFTKRVESFICAACGENVSGDGFTNHCPVCLVSKHVDRDPGDRKSFCGGLMRVVEFEQQHGELRVVHQCGRCGVRKPNRIHANDDPETIRTLMQELSTGARLE
ncbi:MAG: RNHCP domain-containing protein [Candidatus Kerfeldbacteria bacterium]|nr:RNHCP domain-containing protein [Candidatus Kerfeldbacteria bacterium]